jgi:hypothetical protein
MVLALNKGAAVSDLYLEYSKVLCHSSSSLPTEGYPGPLPRRGHGEMIEKLSLDNIFKRFNTSQILRKGATKRKLLCE